MFISYGKGPGRVRPLLPAWVRRLPTDAYEAALRRRKYAVTKDAARAPTYSVTYREIQRRLWRYAEPGPPTYLATRPRPDAAAA